MTSLRDRVDSLLASLARAPELGLISILVALTVYAAAALPAFRTTGNADQILSNSTIIAILALAETLVLLTRQIDLSVGAELGLCAYLVGSALGHVGGGPPVAILMALGLGAVLGLGNALLVDLVRMPAIIATLATLSIYGGLQVVVTHGSQLYAYQLPHWLTTLYATKWGPLPAFACVALVLVVVLTAGVQMTRWGRDLYAMGSNPEAAGVTGLPVRRRTYEAFVACGALSGFAGLLYAAQYGNVDATAGNGIELTAIAAAVIGGVSLFGGSGTPAGAALGALLLIEIENILAIEKISIFAQELLQGLAIVASVAVYALVRRYSQRLGARRRRLQAAGPLSGAAVVEPAEAHP
ncbi:MAG TPA: ABC transporter permease [Gaiellaceae bacterium]|nr:ABC transporter permease [Gaiellaceae bacterium]